MVHNSHVVHRRLQNRQAAIDTPPTASGLTAAVTQSVSATANTLAFNTAAATEAPAATGDVDFSESPTATFVSSSPTSDPSSASSSVNANDANALSSGSPSSSSSSDISMGTVIGACLGALAGCIFIIFIGLCLYRRGNKPRPRSPSNAHKNVDKERAWGKIEDDNEDKWEGKDGGNKHTQKGIVSVAPMEKLTMFKKGTPSMRTTYSTTPDPENAHLPSIAPFDHPFAQYHPGLAEKLAMEDNAELPQPRPFLARVDTMAPISWDGDTVGRDSFLSLNSNSAVSPGQDLALPTPKLTSSEPHHWESAEVVHYDTTASNDEDTDAPRGRPEPRKSYNNPFFGARMSTHSTHSTRSRSNSRSYSQSRASSRAASPEPEPMPAPPPLAYTREQKGKGRAITPPSPRSSIGSGTSTITGAVRDMNPFTDPSRTPPATNTAFAMPVVHEPAHAHTHESTGSHDRALQQLIDALGTTAEDVEARLRVASMQPSVMSEASGYTETDNDTLHQSWPVPPSRPQPGYDD
ncbi:hypothetical protein K438DRAFT_1963527 [Mycena galopus ATCC 62051]|nr:hypothetical protein K438DRAFT_1963527 [Mycena galopus ATCC 62051]